MCDPYAYVYMYSPALALTGPHGQGAGGAGQRYLTPVTDPLSAAALASVSLGYS